MERKREKEKSRETKKNKEMTGKVERQLGPKKL